MGRLRLTSIFGVMLLLLSQLVTVTAWSTGGYTDNGNLPIFGTHDWIALHALNMLPLEEQWWIRENLDAYLLGTELPDNGGHPLGIGDQALHHVYYNSTMTITEAPAANRAQEEYNLALSYLEIGEIEEAAIHAGMMTHYISDLGVFGHVMGVETDWGPETHHSDYESMADTRMNEYPTDTYTKYIIYDGGHETLSAYDGALEVAFDTTFDVDGPYTCTWMDSNYNISDPGFMNRTGESVNLCINTNRCASHPLQ